MFIDSWQQGHGNSLSIVLSKSLVNYEGAGMPWTRPAGAAAVCTVDKMPRSRSAHSLQFCSGLIYGVEMMSFCLLSF